jgi:hypothetical protein
MLQTLATIIFFYYNASDDTLAYFLAVYEPTTVEEWNAAWVDWETDEDDDWDADEPLGSHDLSDDAYALASAGWGTDEDYGSYGGDEW